MFIIWGFGRQTLKEFGAGPLRGCTSCKNHSNMKLYRQRTWFTLFFIPVIPYRTLYFAQCPYCGTLFTMSKQEIQSILDQEPSVSPDASMPEHETQPSYAGKNEVQANYLRETENARQQRAAANAEQKG